MKEREKLRYNRSRQQKITNKLNSGFKIEVRRSNVFEHSSLDNILKEEDDEDEDGEGEDGEDEKEASMLKNSRSSRSQSPPSNKLSPERKGLTQKGSSKFTHQSIIH